MHVFSILDVQFVKFLIFPYFYFLNLSFSQFWKRILLLSVFAYIHMFSAFSFRTGSFKFNVIGFQFPRNQFTNNEMK